MVSRSLAGVVVAGQQDEPADQDDDGHRAPPWRGLRWIAWECSSPRPARRWDAALPPLIAAAGWFSGWVQARAGGGRRAKPKESPAHAAAGTKGWRDAVPGGSDAAPRGARRRRRADRRAGRRRGPARRRRRSPARRAAAPAAGRARRRRARRRIRSQPPPSRTASASSWTAKIDARARGERERRQVVAAVAAAAERGQERRPRSASEAASAAASGIASSR